jgi:RES domain-containing protein
MLAVWRLCDKLHPILDGFGAKQFGGRWNPEGLAVVYAAECVALATLESLVHLCEYPNDYCLIRIPLEESTVRSVEDLCALPSGWRDNEGITQTIGAHWLASPDAWVLSVPSSTAKTGRNYLINPARYESGVVPADPPADYQFDPRLLSLALHPDTDIPAVPI